MEDLLNLADDSERQDAFVRAMQAALVVLGARRREILHATGLALPSANKEGRVLLTTAFDGCFHDGVVADATGNYFDASDLPPWDTWLAFDCEYPESRGAWALLVWVPGPFLQVANRAREVHIVEPYEWLADQSWMDGKS